jgi:hypothetical protein
MAGRGKKRKIPEDEMNETLRLAGLNCKNYTIEKILGWHNGFIERRPDIAKKLHKKRAEFVAELREAQTKQINNPSMAIFLGKNYLQ